LDTLPEEGTGLFPKPVMHHGQCSFRPLICVPTRFLDTKFMAVLRLITAHIDDASILGYISSTMLDTVILFIVHDVVSVSVFLGKVFGALFKVAAQKPKTEKFR
jgi:hypothetical protein